VRDWDGELAVDSAGAAIYQAWLVRMVEGTFKAKLGDELYAEYVAYGRFAVPALHALVAEPRSSWFDAAGEQSGGRDIAAATALEEAVADLRLRLGPDPRRWRWGAVHTVTFEHVLGATALGALLNIGPVERGGDGYTVNNGAFLLARPFAPRSHPSVRMIVDLGDLDASRSVLPTGQSGQPLSKHWGDQTALWAAGELKRMPFTRGALGEPEARLVLRAR
ncbi:MAG: penicillin acylase family protein, partial [Candidatus Limnocylindria bacterium]